MPGEFSLYGVFIPSLLVWMLAAFAITSGARSADAPGVLQARVAPFSVQSGAVRDRPGWGGCRGAVVPIMKFKLSSLGPVVLTLAVTAVGAVVVKHLWDYYTVAPWTRDGHIRAEVVQVAPDVSGLVTRIAVKDNQRVKAGDLLFEIDHERYALALRQAQATAAAMRASLAQYRREANRSQKLAEVVSREVVEEGLAKVQQGEATLAQAEAAVDVAKLNLDRTRVVSPVEGYVNDRLPRPGRLREHRQARAVDGRCPVVHVEGYFEETKLHGIHIGSPVDIRIMGEKERAAWPCAKHRRRHRGP